MIEASLKTYRAAEPVEYSAGQLRVMQVLLDCDFSEIEARILASMDDHGPKLLVLDSCPAFDDELIQAQVSYDIDGGPNPKARKKAQWKQESNRKAINYQRK